LRHPSILLVVVVVLFLGCFWVGGYKLFWSPTHGETAEDEDDDDDEED
jgi:hypothetical protein